MKTLIALCSGGMGNKFLHFFSCIYLAYINNMKLVLISINGNFSEFKFEDFFNMNIETNYIKTKDQNTLNELINKYDIKTFYHHEEVHEISLNDYNCIIQDRSKQFNDKLTENTLYFSNFIIPNINLDILKFALNNITIKEDKFNKYKEFIDKNNINEKTLGVHFRGTDIHGIKIEDLIDNINKSGKTFDKVFVCSDEKSKENQLLRTIRNSVRYEKKYYVEKSDNNKNWKLNCVRNEESCHEAFIDCLILGKCNIVNDGTFSTFRILGKLMNKLYL
jgi:hypothetical protein